MSEVHTVVSDAPVDGRLALVARMFEKKPDWCTDARCLGAPLELFYPFDQHEAAELTETALSICAECRVRDECRTYGLEHEMFGLWGGLWERCGVASVLVGIRGSSGRRRHLLLGWMFLGRVVAPAMGFGSSQYQEV